MVQPVSEKKVKIHERNVVRFKYFFLKLTVFNAFNNSCTAAVEAVSSAHFYLNVKK